MTNSKRSCENDNSAISIFLCCFVLMLVLAWLSVGSGVICNDPERNIYIPDDLTMPLQVMASYTDSTIFFRYC